MLARWKKSAAVVALAFGLWACGQESEKTAPTEAAPQIEFQPIAEGRLESGGGQWLFEGPAEYAEQGDQTLFRLQGPTAVVRVFQTPVEAGKAYDLRVGLERTGGAAPADVRVILSRDCAVAAEDFGEQQAALAPGQSTNMTVTHTFKRNYPCAKMVLHVLNASAADPAVISIASAELAPQ